MIIFVKQTIMFYDVKGLDYNHIRTGNMTASGKYVGVLVGYVFCIL